MLMMLWMRKLLLMHSLMSLINLISLRRWMKRRCALFEVNKEMLCCWSTVMMLVMVLMGNAVSRSMLNQEVL